MYQILGIERLGLQARLALAALLLSSFMGCAASPDPRALKDQRSADEHGWSSNSSALTTTETRYMLFEGTCHSLACCRDGNCDAPDSAVGLSCGGSCDDSTPWVARPHGDTAYGCDECVHVCVHGTSTCVDAQVRDDSIDVHDIAGNAALFGSLGISYGVDAACITSGGLTVDVGPCTGSSSAPAPSPDAGVGSTTSSTGSSDSCHCDASCGYCWCGTASENHCDDSWKGAGDGCDCGCQWTDPDCSGSSSGSSVPQEGDPCTVGSRTGECVDTGSGTCDGELVSGVCGGADTVECCLPVSSGSGSSTTLPHEGDPCTVGSRTGQCVDTGSGTCDGELVSGACGGADTVECCLPVSSGSGSGSVDVGTSCSDSWGGTGECIDTTSNSCFGTLESGLCPGGSNIQCCISSGSTGSGGTCSTSLGTGSCIDTNTDTCGGTLQSGVCPGGSNIQCCVSTTGSSGGTSGSPSGSGSSCGNSTGTGECIDTSTSACYGTLASGLCPGGSSVQCCITAATAPPAGTSCSGSLGSGSCIDTNTDTCGGTLEGGLCPGGSNIECCISGSSSGTSGTASGVGSSCSEGSMSGTCIDTSTDACGGTLESGLCPGGSSIKCCLLY